MLDLSAPVRRLYRRLLGAPADTPATRPGAPAEAVGAVAVATLEAWICGTSDARAEGRAGFARALGLAAAGQRAAVFLSGPELGRGLDLLAEAARRRLAVVVHAELEGDHAPCHAAAATGAVLLFATDVQEAADLTLVARRLAEDALLPVVVALDGRETGRALQDLRLVERALLEDFLGRAEELVHPPTAAQEMVFGKHRRRLPRWHDPERALLTGALPSAEAATAIAVSGAVFFDTHAAELWARASQAFEAAAGRALPALRTHLCERAKLLVVAQGAAVETAEAVAEHLRAEDGLRLGVVGLRRLHPWPTAELAELLRGRETVVVLERGAPTQSGEPPLARELAAPVARARARLVPLSWGAGEAALDGSELAVLCAGLGARKQGTPRRRLGLGAAASHDYPKQQALRDTLLRSYPALAELDAETAVPRVELRPEGGFTIAIHHPTATDGALTSATGELLHRLLGGHLRVLPGAGARSATDLVHWAPTSLRDPGAGVVPELALWLSAAGRPAHLPATAPGEALFSTCKGEVYRIGGLNDGPHGSERLLGALIGVLLAEGHAPTTLRKLQQARRELLEERGEPEIEARLSALQGGFEEVAALAPGSWEPAPAPVPSALPAVVRRRGRGEVPVADLASFHDRVGVLYRDGRGGAVAPEPFLATAALPPLTAVLTGGAPERTMLPAFAPEPCTGCGACWTVCPEGAVGAVVIGAASLLEQAMARAREGGAAVDKLRMAVSKIAEEVRKTIAGEGWAGGEAGSLFETAFAATLGAMKLPDERKSELRNAWSAVAPELAGLPVARTAAFFDRPETAQRGSGELLALALDPAVCTGCGLCIAACEPAALAAQPDTAERTTAARALWQRCELLPPPAPATRERAAADPEVGPLAAALLDPAARVMSGSGGEPGSGARLALRQVLGAMAHRRAAIVAEEHAKIAELRARLAEVLHGELAHALPDRDLDKLARGLDALEAPDADLAALTARVETAFETERVDVARTRRLVEAARGVADVEWRLTKGEGGQGWAPLGLVLSADGPLRALAAFPSQPFQLPVVVDATGDAVELARGVLAGQQAQTLELARALRKARFEIEKPGGPKAPEAAAMTETLAHLGWHDLEPDERRLCPPLMLAASDALLAGPALGSLLAALGSGVPLKILLLADLPLRETLELPRLAALAPAAWLGQTSIAAPEHLEPAVGAVLGHEGPALLRVLAPSPGPAADSALARARAALAAGFFALYRSDTTAAVSEPAAPAPAAPPAPELETRHAAELAALRAHYETQIAGLRASYQQETAQRLRARLLAFATAPRAHTSPETPS